MTVADATDPNSQQVDPIQPSDEEMQNFLAGLGDDFEYTPGTGASIANLLTKAGVKDLPPVTPTGEEEDDEDDDEYEEEVVTEPVTGEQPEGYIINGTLFPKEDIERLYNFDQYLRANPDTARRVNDAITQPASAAPPTGQSTVPSPPEQADTFTPPDPPDFLDMEDARDKFSWDAHVATLKTQFDAGIQFKQQQAQLAQQQQQAHASQAQADMVTALGKFRGTFTNLNDEDMATIRKEAQAYIPGLLPTMSGADALYRSMEIAGWSNQEIKAKLENPDNPNPTTQHKAKTRKQRLGAISGSPRSAPKTDSRPLLTTDRDAINAFAQGLAESMGR